MLTNDRVIADIKGRQVLLLASIDSSCALTKSGKELGFPGYMWRFIAFLMFAVGTMARADVTTGFLGAGDTARKDSVSRSDTVKYASDSLEYDAQTRLIMLLGNAHLDYRTTKLTADTIYFDQTTQILDAQGRPDIQDPQIAPLLGRRLKYNMKSKIGAVYQARSYKAGEYYRGAEVRRLGDKTLQVIDGDYCKCQNVEVPDYYFATAKMEIEPERQATAAPVVLNIEEVPVLVAPFVMFPLGKGRRSGLLTPKLGGDQKQGFFARNLGAYWGISDYMDLTTVTDVVEGSAGRFDQLNGDGTFRYARRYWLTGHVQGKKYLRELGDAGSGWEVRYDHSQELLPQPDKFTLKGSGSFVSSATVRSTNALTAAEILDQTANANLATTYKWDKDRATLIASASQQENLRTGIRDRELPAASFSASGELIPREDVDDTAWYKSLNYSYSNRMSAYSYRSADSISRAQWNRYSEHPDSLPRPAPHDQEYLGGTQNLTLGINKPLGYLNLNTSGNFQHDWTGRSYTEPANSTGAWRAWSETMDPDNVLTWSARTDASTKLYGTWLPYWGRFMGMRHTLVPSAGYQYVPKIDTHKYFVPHPRLGQRIGQDKAQLLNLSLGQQLDTKIMDATSDTAKSRAKKGVPYSLMSLNTGASYDFEKEIRPWSNITTSYSTGIPQMQFTGTLVHTLYDPWGDSLTEGVPTLMSWSLSFAKGTRVGGSFSDGWRMSSDSTTFQPWSLSADYSYSIQATRVSEETFRETRTQSAGFGAELKPSRNWAASWRSSYDFELGSFVSHSLSFKRTLGCWDMNFGWTPVGPARGWTFLIQIRDLPDVKMQAQSSTLRKTAASTTPGSTSGTKQ